MEGKTPYNPRAPEGYVLMKTISDKYTKDVIEECDELRRTKQRFLTFNVLCVASVDCTNDA